MLKKIIDFFKKLFGKKEVVVEKGTTIVIPNGLTEKGEKEVETITLEETVVVPVEKKTKKTTKKKTTKAKKTTKKKTTKKEKK